MRKEKKGISLNGFSACYDLLTPAECSRLRRRQIELAGVREGEAVLDVGCGPGALTVLAGLAAGRKGSAAGIDLAPRMIERARRKAKRIGLEIDFRVASVDDIPWPDGSFDLVISSMMFHHLPVRIKEAALLEIHRVLKPEGRLFLYDFAVPSPLTFPLMLLLLVWIAPTRYQLLGRLPALIRRCGFVYSEWIHRGIFFNGTLNYKQRWPARPTEEPDAGTPEIGGEQPCG